MRMPVSVDIPHEPFNSLVRASTAGDKIAKILDSLKPQAVYFTEEHGRRRGRRAGGRGHLQRRLPIQDRDEPGRVGEGGARGAGKAVGVGAGSSRA
jgi:hypothetical protein